MVTRKKKTKVMTIPQLRKAFETIEKKSSEIKSVREFQEVFGFNIICDT